MTTTNTEIGAFINAQTEDTTPDGSADFLLSYDASATAVKKVKVGNVGAAGGVALAHGCRLKRASGDFSVGNNTFTAVEFNAEDYDTDTMHDNSTNPTRITIPTIAGVTTGLWSFKAWGYTGITTGRINTEFRVGGSTVISWSEEPASSGVIGAFLGVAEYVLAAGDYVELLVRTTAGSGSVVYDAGLSPFVTASFRGKVS